MTRMHVDMNVTPLIDVLLVLIVIFLAALPLTQKAIDSDLPSEVRSPGAAAPPEQIMLEYAADGRIAINHQDVTAESLGARLSDIYSSRRDKTLYVAGAPSLRYRSIISVIDAAKGAGVDRIGIVTESMRKAGAANGGGAREGSVRK